MGKTTSFRISYFTLCFTLFCTTLIAQQKGIDSLKLRLNQHLNDTDRVNTFHLLYSQLSRSGNYNTAMFYAKNALKLSDKIHFKRGIINSYINIGNVYYLQGYYTNALSSYYKALQISEKYGFKYGISSSQMAMGNIFFAQGNYSEALKKYYTALKIEKELGNKRSLITLYLNIGTIFQAKKNHTDALSNFTVAFQI